MEIRKLSPRCIRFSLKPLNRWDLYSYLLIGDKNIYVIDTGCGQNDAKYIKDYIKKEKIGKPIIIINTHYHWDHIWGNAYFNSKFIISSEECYKMINNNWDGMLKRNLEYVNGKTEKCLPNVTFSDKLSIKDDNLELVYLTGHTLDGICIYDKVDKFLYVGDNIGDDEEYIIPQLESTKEEYLCSLQKMMEFDCQYVLSGHNDIQNKKFIQNIIDLITSK